MMAATQIQNLIAIANDDGGLFLFDNKTFEKKAETKTVKYPRMMLNVDDQYILVGGHDGFIEPIQVKDERFTKLGVPI